MCAAAFFFLYLKPVSCCRCPTDGLKETFQNCHKAYRALNAAANFSFYIAPAGHEVTQDMDARVVNFFEKHLLPDNHQNSTTIQVGKPQDSDAAAL